MPGEAWTAVSLISVAIISSLLAPIVIAWVKKRFGDESKQLDSGIESNSEDVFREKWLRRLEELETLAANEQKAKAQRIIDLEAAFKEEQRIKVECLMKLSKARVELKLAEKRREADIETIRRLRERVDYLEEIVRRGSRDD